MRWLPLVAAAVLVAGCEPGGQDATTKLDDPQARMSYALGMSHGRHYEIQGVPVDPELIAQGLQDTLAGEPQIDDETMVTQVALFKQKVREAQSARAKQRAEEAAQQGAALQEQFAAEDGVQRTDSGLLYKVIVPGEGPTPTKNDIVKVHYQGQLVDGTVFQDTGNQPGPQKMAVRLMIPGWQEAVMKMPLGAEWELVVPPKLAFGDAGAGHLIPPNSTLRYRIELVEIVTPPGAADSQG